MTLTDWARKGLPCTTADVGEFLAMECELFESITAKISEFEKKYPPEGLTYNAKMTAVARAFFSASGETENKEAMKKCRRYLQITSSFIVADEAEGVKP